MPTEVMVAIVVGIFGLVSGALGFVGRVLLHRINAMHDDNRNDHGMVRAALHELTGQVTTTNVELRDVKADVRDVKTDVRDLRTRVTDLEEDQ